MTATVIRLPSRSGRTPAQPMDDAEERAPRAELRRARIRIAQLEASLTEAMRDNVRHFERARAAEQRLADLSAGRELDEPLTGRSDALSAGMSTPHAGRHGRRDDF